MNDSGSYKRRFSSSGLYTNSVIKRVPKRKKGGSTTPALQKSRLLAAKVGDEPEEKGQRDAEKKTRDDGKVKRGVFAAVKDVAGQFSEAERELVAEIKKDTNQNKKCSEKDKSAAEFTERVHRIILPEPADKSRRQPSYYH